MNTDPMYVRARELAVKHGLDIGELPKLMVKFARAEIERQRAKEANRE